MSDVSKLVEALKEARSVTLETTEITGLHRPALICQIDEALSTFTAETSADNPAHTVEREKGYREGIEAAAKVAETAGPAHYSSLHKGLTRHTSEAEAFIARKIRSLSSSRPASKDSDNDGSAA